MALTAAELVAYLRMDKSGFDRDLSSAERDMGKSSGKFKDWTKGMGQAAVETATAGAAATAGLATAVFLTGANYNTLQQQSRAALETIMGSAAKANAQMDKLDEFATTSPFAKDVFIQAQQQLLGFGMEAERVVPTLGAIQDAVAAVGGSNEDIAGIATVLAKVEGTGKLTADTLNQLGIRGIDAASIIGEEMGKSGNTIRESITEGSLDADKALEALTDGMTKRFGGAAENVKNTMVGALDRIKAATRDIGAEMARPFVDPNGGGKAVDWANEFADVLRAVERQTVPFVEIMMRRFAPAFDTVSESLKGAKEAVDRFDMRDFESALDRVSSYAPAIAGVSGALLTMGTANVPIIGRLASALGPIPAALTAAALASPEMRDALGELWDTAKPLVSTLGDVAEVSAGVFTEGVGIAANVLQLALDVIGPVVDGFDRLPTPIKTATGALTVFIATQKLMPGFTKTFSTNMGSIVSSVSGAVDALSPWGSQFEGAAGQALTFGTRMGIVASDVGTSARGGLRGALGGVVGFLGGPWGVALATATVALGFWAQKQAETKENIDELSESLDEQSGAWTAQTDSLVASRVAEEYSSESLERLGLSYEDLVESLKDGEEGYDDLHEKLLANYNANIDAEEGTSAYNAALATNKEEVEKVLGPVATLQEELAEAKQEVLDNAEALRVANEAADESERSFQRYVEAVAILRDDTKSAEERVRAFRDALDELEGGTKTAEERQRELAGQARTLAGFFRDATDDTEGFKDELFDLEKGIVDHTDEGDRLNDMLSRMQTQADQAAQAAIDLAQAEGRTEEAAADAAAAQKPYVDEIKNIGEQFNLTDEEIKVMLDTLDLVPEEQSFLLTDEGSTEQKFHEVQNLISEIQDIPDGKTWTSDGGTTQDVIDILEDLDYDVKHLDDGEIQVKARGVQPTIDEIVAAAAGPYEATINVKTATSGARRDLMMLDTGREPSPGKGVRKPRYHGAIDLFRGMADGGLTPPSVMDVAQMVAPGDIRFAGDRSDVDEAWIPLDGSTRSRAILNEAIARMPGFELPTATGMASGGIDGEISMPEVGEVSSPDTSPLTDVWDQTMQMLLESTRDNFSEIESDSAESQDATTENTRTNMNLMRTITESQLGSMVALTAQNMADMDRATGTATGSMKDATSAEFNAMRAIGISQADQLRSNTAAQFQSMRDAGESQTSALRVHSGQQFAAIQADGTSQASQLRASAATQFSLMRDQGVSAAGDLRSGIVSEMGQTRSPFTGRVNDLVDVMRSFSSALNKAYGDMGVDVGTPTRLATGGIMPGYTPGLDVHSFSSPTGGQLELSGGEAVMRPEFTRAVGSDWIHSMNAAARTGGVSAIRDAIAGPTQAFADGGIIGEFTGDAKRIGSEHKAKLPANWLKSAGAHTIDEVIKGIETHMESMMGGDGWVRPTSGRITSPYGAGRGAYPHAGIDIAGGHGRVVSATGGVVRDTGMNIGPGRTGLGVLIEHLGGLFTYSGHAPIGGIRVKPGDPVAPGQHISHQGSTGNATGDHLHWEVHRDRAWNDVNPMPWWNAAGSGGGIASGGSGGGSDRWGAVIRQALALNKLPTTERYVSAWLRQVQTESGGNPSAVQGIRDINSIRGNHARGLLQVIPPTFAAYSLPGMKSIMNPLHNAAAGMAYAKSRYGVTGMLNAIGQGRGYELGTHHARDGWHMVGEAGAELVNFKGGETVLNNRQTKQVLAGPEIDYERMGKAIAKYQQSRGDLNFNGPLSKDDRGIAKGIATELRRETKRLARL